MDHFFLFLYIICTQKKKFSVRYCYMNEKNCLFQIIQSALKNLSQPSLISSVLIALLEFEVCIIQQVLITVAEANCNLTKIIPKKIFLH